MSMRLDLSIYNIILYVYICTCIKTYLFRFDIVLYKFVTKLIKY